MKNVLLQGSWPSLSILVEMRTIKQGFPTGRLFDAGVTNFDARVSNLT